MKLNNKQKSKTNTTHSFLLQHELSLGFQDRLQQGFQHGSALLTSLVFLVILTILGFTASRSVIMQELISRNFSDRNLALQSAEAALKYAESCIRNSNGLPTGPGSVALTCVRRDAPTPVQFRPYSEQAVRDSDSAFWTTNGTMYGSMTAETPLSLPAGNLAQQPRYVIAVLNRIGCVINGTQSCQYQISAWGTGVNPTAQKVVQSVFIR
jgi:type IV pilus assembly protein PilX